MRDILEEIVEFKKLEVALEKEKLSEREIHSRVEELMEKENNKKRSMSKALKDSQYGIIAEFKRKSPSKGWIHEDAPLEDVTLKYEKNGASALSILTDEKYFGGSKEFIKKIRKDINIPILRKDFIIDEYQLFQAKLIGADAVLLIAADLKKDHLKELSLLAHELGLETLLEIHQEEELSYCEIPVSMIGVNNRNLGTFVTKVENSFKLSEKLPKDIVKVSESGISNPQTIKELRKVGFRGFLMGECFMREKDPGKALKEFILELEK